MPISRGALYPGNDLRIALATAVLACPACGENVRLAAHELIEGGEVECLTCTSALAVTQGWDDVTGRHLWILIDSLEDFDDLNEHP